MKISMLVVASFLAMALTACYSQPRSAESAYIVDSQGAVSPTTRSALAGSTAPGKQEIIGVYIPFIGTGLAAKAGLEWDGTPTVIQVPMSAAAPSSCAQSIDVEETYTVPETRMVTKTRTVRKVVLPVPPQAVDPCAPAPTPQAAPCAPPAPQAAPCAPPQAAPKKAPGCEPVAALPPPQHLVCDENGNCSVPGK